MSRAYCTKCGAEVFESSVTIATEDSLGKVAMVPVPPLPLNKPCGHRAPFSITDESSTYPHDFDGR